PLHEETEPLVLAQELTLDPQVVELEAGDPADGADELEVASRELLRRAARVDVDEPEELLAMDHRDADEGTDLEIDHAHSEVLAVRHIAHEDRFAVALDVIEDRLAHLERLGFAAAHRIPEAHDRQGV